MSNHWSYYFDLSSYSHASLFISCESVWEALSSIPNYLSSLPLGQHLGSVSPQAYLENADQIYLGNGSIIEAGAYVQGPCWIGDHCVVRHGAYIRGELITGNHCVIGHTTEVKNTIFLDGVHAAHFAYIGDSILGNAVNLGAGTKCANLRLDRAPVSVENAEKKKTETGRRKLGAIIGDRCQIGCNTVLNPGALIGPDTRCHPCLNLKGFIPAHSMVRSNVHLEVKPYV